MKRKFIVFVVLLQLFFFASVQAQGLYNKTQQQKKESSESTSEQQNLDNFFQKEPLRAPSGSPVDPSPIGEGLLILSSLAGAYAFKRFRSVKKNS